MLNATTVYDWLLSLPDEVQKYFWCILDEGKLYFRRTLIFENYRFIAPISTKYLGTISVEELNSIKLIPLVGTTNWQAVVAALYDNYKTYVPRYTKNFLNFPYMDTNTYDPLTMHCAHEYDRLALELFILFHKASGDIVWPDNKKFFVKVSDKCVVYKKWIT